MPETSAGPLIICPDRQKAAFYETEFWNDAPLVVGDHETLASLDLSVFSLLLVDANLSDVNLVKDLKARRAKSALPPVCIYVVDGRSRASWVQAKAIGATEILRRPVRPADLAPFKRRSAPAIELPKTVSLKPQRTASEQAVDESADELGALFDGLVGNRSLDTRALRTTSRSILGAIGEDGLGRWLETVRNHHSGTYQHCLLVTGVAAAFVKRLGLGDADGLKITEGAMLHDIGKIRIPRELLDKPGALTEAEFAVVRKHPILGHDYLKANADLPSPILDMVLHHHEYLDGSGYPDALSGSAVTDPVRILTICDIYGALVEQRAYKLPTPPRRAYGMLEEMAASGKLDRALVEAFRPVVGMVPT